MSKAAERIQRAVEFVREHEHTWLRTEAIERLREVVNAVRRERAAGLDRS